jgi:fluoride exporter
MMDISFVAMGGFLGAICRFTISKKVKNKNGFPIATLFVNLLGAFLLGVLFGIQPQSHVYALFGVGFMGAFTTFSTFKLETEQLRKTKRMNFFYGNLGLSYMLGITLAYIGLIIGEMFK